MNTILILLLMGFLAFSLFYFANKLSNKKIENTTSDQFKPLIDELKNIDTMKFQTVSDDIIYSHTFSVFFRTIGYLISFAAIALCLDFLTIKHFIINNYSDLLIYIGVYLFASFVVFIFSLLSCTWDYTYFKYGLSHQIKNTDLAFEYIKKIRKQIIKNYTVVFVASYLFGRFAFGFGLIGVLIGTVLYELGITIYFALEVKRIGFAPVFNLFSEKLNEFRNGKNEK